MQSKLAVFLVQKNEKNQLNKATISEFSKKYKIPRSTLYNNKNIDTNCLANNAYIYAENCFMNLLNQEMLFNEDLLDDYIVKFCDRHRRLLEIACNYAEIKLILASVKRYVSYYEQVCLSYGKKVTEKDLDEIYVKGFAICVKINLLINSASSDKKDVVHFLLRFFKGKR